MGITTDDLKQTVKGGAKETGKKILDTVIDGLLTTELDLQSIRHEQYIASFLSHLHAPQVGKFDQPLAVEDIDYRVDVFFKGYKAVRGDNAVLGDRWKVIHAYRALPFGFGDWAGYPLNNHLFIILLPPGDQIQSGFLGCRIIASPTSPNLFNLYGRMARKKVALLREAIDPNMSLQWCTLEAYKCHHPDLETTKPL